MKASILAFVLGALPSVAVAQSDPPVPLAEGEVIVETIATPGIVRMPEVAPVPVYDPAPVSPPPAYIERETRSADGVTRLRVERLQIAPNAPGLLPRPAQLGAPMRDRTGWTGRKADPVAVGCFPRGACVELNGF